MRRIILLSAAIGLIMVAPASPQVGGPQARIFSTPRLEPVAETSLLMQGINVPNFEGLERLLKQKPADMAAWTIIRGQALLIAENGNLLMMRPPRNPGESLWMERATALRSMATQLARAAADRDYQRCRTGLSDLANTCNRCHQSFNVRVTITAFGVQAGDRFAPPAPPSVPQPTRPPPTPRPPQKPI